MLAYDWNFLGLSTETKPMTGEKVVDGSTFYECDTSSFFIFYQGEWYQQTFVTEDGINFWLYRTLMKKMFGKWFDGNISLGKIIKPTTGTEIEFTNSLPAQITDLTGYGDTFQQTYSGTNLFNRATAAENYILAWTTSNNYADAGSLTSDYIAASGGDSFISKYWCAVFFYDSSDTYLGCLLSGGTTIDKTPGAYFRTFTVPSEYSIAKMRVVFRKSQGGNPSDMTTVNDIMLNSGTTLLPYEPYTGSTASPNPDYPQTINVVTGEQTVTINGEQVYPIDLGTIELCKIGDYQDYIYKSGDDWYVHKDCGKIELDGSDDETWSIAKSGTDNFFYAYNSIPNYLYTGLAQGFICSAGIGASVGSSTTDNGVSITNVAEFRIRYGTEMTLANWKSYLSSTPMSVYYRLATPTDTIITDSTLISNLNSLLKYIFPVGEHQIVITADDLPMALKLTITEKE